MTGTNKTLVEINSVSAGYKDKIVLKDVSLSINEHDFIGIIGPNGGGKTTLMNVIIGILHPFAGSIRYEGNTSSSFSIGYLPQKSQFDVRFPISVQEVVCSGLPHTSLFFRRYTKDDIMKAEAVMQQFGIIHLRNNPIGEISGGQLQRALLARAVVSSPKLLILDEPGTYVDNIFEKELYLILTELNKRMAILLVSHDIGIISSVVKTIACVNGALHYHASNEINEEVLKSYNCPIDLIAHGHVPHRVLKNH